MSISRYTGVACLLVSAAALKVFAPHVQPSAPPDPVPLQDGGGYLNFQNISEAPASFYIDGNYACATAPEGYSVASCRAPAAPGIHAVKAVRGTQEISAKACVSERYGMGMMGQCVLELDDYGEEVYFSCYSCESPGP